MAYNPFSLEKKTILVTGASSGIGRGIAVECSKMGGRVVVSGRNKERLKKLLLLLEGTGHLAIQADLLKQEKLTLWLRIVRLLMVVFIVQEFLKYVV